MRLVRRSAYICLRSMTEGWDASLTVKVEFLDLSRGHCYGSCGSPGVSAWLRPQRYRSVVRHGSTTNRQPSTRAFSRFYLTDIRMYIHSYSRHTHAHAFVPLRRCKSSPLSWWTRANKRTPGTRQCKKQDRVSPLATKTPCFRLAAASNQS